MDGTIGLWFEPKDTARHAAPKLSLHINVWKDVSKTYNFLDIGFRLRDTENLRRFFLFFPADLRRGAVSDLSRVLKFGKVLHAVFNDVVEVTDTEEQSFRTEVEGAPFLMVHHLDPDTDISIEPVLMANNQTGSTIMFTDRLCSRLRARTDIDHYVRIRLKLTERLDQLLSSEVRSGDWRFASAASDLELTEIRLNERRSFPPEIMRASRDRFFNIESIHYFLVRHVEKQLVLQYPEARKVRRLEPALWGPYLSDQPAIEPKRLKQVIGKLMIYHWRGVAPSATPAGAKETGTNRPAKKPGIDDFIVFASFRRAQPNHLIYAVAIVLLGAMGSALFEILRAPKASVLGAVSILGVLGLLLLLLYVCTIQPLRSLLSKILRWAGSLTH